MAEVEACLREDTRWHVFNRSGSDIYFVPKDWLDWMPRVGLDSKEHPQSWLVMFFEVQDGSLNFLVSVRKMSDPAMRQRVVEMLLARGEEFGFKRKQKGEVKFRDHYTRVSSRDRFFRWQGDGELPADSIREAVRKKLNDVHPRLSGLPHAIQKALKAT